MGSRVETFEQIRRDRDREGTSTRALAARYGVHRRAVRQALAAPLPPVKRKPVGRPAPKLGPYRGLIDGWLDGDRDAPRKQRHTAKRIWERLRDEHAADVAERTVREYVHDRRAERGEGVQAFVPQVHGAGVEAEVDWGEAQVAMAGSAARVYLFHMRACHSGAAFAMAFPHCSQQAFLEAHVHAFDWFGGVFGLLRYDNLASAVKQVLRGRRRVETDRFIALRSHYLYESQFTTPGIEGAHEKGGVEGEVGRFRRRHFVPVPDVSSLGELNARMLAGCETDPSRRITGRQETVGESFALEANALMGLPAEAFDCARLLTARVDNRARVSVRQCFYSVPARYAGRRLPVRLAARTVEVYDGPRLVARHERAVGRYVEVLNLDHYLEVLKTKPGGLPGATALAQAKTRGVFTASHQAYWDAARRARGDTKGTRALIAVLLAHRTMPTAALIAAMDRAVASGCLDPETVIIDARRHTAQITAVVTLGPLARYDRPPPSLTDYDDLLTGSDS